MMNQWRDEQRLTVGVIGGLGPEATCVFYQRLIDLTPARRDQDHLHVIIDSDPTTPDRTQALLCGGESPVPWLTRSARLLEAAGAEILAMPCVTAHAFIDEVRAAVSVPVLSMVEATAACLRAEHGDVRHLGLLATDGAIARDIFAPLRQGCDVLTPTRDEQRNVMSSIYGPRGVKTVGPNDDGSKLVEEVAGALVERGAEVIVAGCTEIPLAIRPENVAVPVLDTLEILAAAVVVAAARDVTHAPRSRS